MPQRVQTVIFSKEQFTRAQATKWAKDHDFRSDKVDETSTSFRLRQMDPATCRPGSFQTLTENFPAGISAVSCNVVEKRGGSVELLRKFLRDRAAKLREAFTPKENGPEPEEFRHTFKITKVDEEQRIAYGWASVIEENGETVFDHQGDAIDESELEDAAIDFVLHSRVGGVMHKVQQKARLCASLVFTKAIQDALGIDLKRIGWFVGFRFDDDEAWEGVKSGARPMFSIGGTAVREPVE